MLKMVWFSFYYLKEQFNSPSITLRAHYVCAVIIISPFMSWAFLVAPWKNILVLMHSCLLHTGPASKSQIWYQMQLSVTKKQSQPPFFMFSQKAHVRHFKVLYWCASQHFFSLSNPLNVYFCCVLDPLDTVAPLKGDTLEFFKSSSNPIHPVGTWRDGII